MIANRGWESDKQITEIISTYVSQFEESMKTEIGVVGTNLDSTQTRVKENTMSNFVTDALRETYEAEVRSSFCCIDVDLVTLFSLQF